MRVFAQLALVALVAGPALAGNPEDDLTREGDTAMSQLREAVSSVSEFEDGLVHAGMMAVAALQGVGAPEKQKMWQEELEHVAKFSKDETKEQIKKIANSLNRNGYEKRQFERQLTEAKRMHAEQAKKDQRAVEQLESTKKQQDGEFTKALKALVKMQNDAKQAMSAVAALEGTVQQCQGSLQDTANRDALATAKAMLEKAAAAQGEAVAKAQAAFKSAQAAQPEMDKLRQEASSFTGFAKAGNAALQDTRVGGPALLQLASSAKRVFLRGGTQVGQTEAAAGQTQTAAGQTQTAAGQTQTAAGQTQTAAGQTQTAAGQTQTAAGQTQTAAGQTQTAAGQTQTAAGQTQTAAGQTQTAAGQPGAEGSDVVGGAISELRTKSSGHTAVVGEVAGELAGLAVKPGQVASAAAVAEATANKERIEAKAAKLEATKEAKRVARANLQAEVENAEGAARATREYMDRLQGIIDVQGRDITSANQRSVEEAGVLSDAQNAAAALETELSTCEVAKKKAELELAQLKCLSDAIAASEDRVQDETSQMDQSTRELEREMQETRRDIDGSMAKINLVLPVE